MEDTDKKYPNQEAFILSAKRIKARMERAKELQVAELNGEELTELVENLCLAKGIEQNKPAESFRKGQEYYIQLLLDSVKKPITQLLDAEYAQATMELSTSGEILKLLEDFRKS